MATASRISEFSGIKSRLLRNSDGPGSVRYEIEFPMHLKDLAGDTAKLVRDELRGKTFSSNITTLDFTVGYYEYNAVTLKGNGWHEMTLDVFNSVSGYIERTANKINGMYRLEDTN